MEILSGILNISAYSIYSTGGKDDWKDMKSGGVLTIIRSTFMALFSHRLGTCVVVRLTSLA